DLLAAPCHGATPDDRPTVVQPDGRHGRRGRERSRRVLPQGAHDPLGARHALPRPRSESVSAIHGDVCERAAAPIPSAAVGSKNLLRAFASRPYKLVSLCPVVTRARMAEFLLIESRDPFESNEVGYYCELARGLAHDGHAVTMFLVQNAVLAARPSK